MITFPMLTTLLLSFLVPSTLGVIAWAYNQSLTIRTLENRLEKHKDDIVTLKGEVKEIYSKYDKIFELLIEIKLELKDKKDKE